MMMSMSPDRLFASLIIIILFCEIRSVAPGMELVL